MKHATEFVKNRKEVIARREYVESEEGQVSAIVQKILEKVSVVLEDASRSLPYDQKDPYSSFSVEYKSEDLFPKSFAEKVIVAVTDKLNNYGYYVTILHRRAHDYTDEYSEFLITITP